MLVDGRERVIEGPDYCGLRVDKWTEGKPVRTKYPGLVSIETFNRANRGKVRIDERADGTLSIRYGEKRCPKRLKNNPEYPYKNVIMCPACKTKPLLGSASRGNTKTYPAYHCNRGHYFSVPKAALEETVETYLRRFYLEPDDRKRFEAALRLVWDQRQDEIARAQVETAGTIRELRTQQQAVLDSLIGASEPVRGSLR